MLGKMSCTTLDVRPDKQYLFKLAEIERFIPKIYLEIFGKMSPDVEM